MRGAGSVLTPILTYHKIAPPPRETIYPGTYVHPATFAQHIAYLSRRYKFATVAEYLDDRRSPERVVLTFDDGTADFAANALPVLERFAARATVYIVTDERTNAWDVRLGDQAVPLLTHDEVCRLPDSIECGSHTSHHVDLAEIEAERFPEEIVRSREEIENILSRPCRTFCYPYGRKREAAIAAVREAGYSGAVTTEKGTNDVGTDPFLLRRIAVRNDTPLPILVYKLWRARRFGR